VTLNGPVKVIQRPRLDTRQARGHYRDAGNLQLRHDWRIPVTERSIREIHLRQNQDQREQE